MTLDHRQHHLEAIRATLSLLISPLQYAVNLPFAIGHWAGEGLATRGELIEENRTLREQALLQEARLQKLATLLQENERLRSLLQSSSPGWEQVRIAEILSVDSTPFRQQFLVNRGAGDGVYDGHPVIDAHGVVGQVTHTTPYTSTVMLLTDPSHAIPVQNLRSGLRAIALGTGEPGELELPHIPNNADVQVGDLLISSGLGLRFPQGYHVAVISRIELDPTQPYARIHATPTAHLESANEVLLVWPNSNAQEAGEGP